MKLDVAQKSQHFRQMKPKMAARMNTTLLVFWGSDSTSKNFHYYDSILKSNHYCGYNRVRRTMAINVSDVVLLLRFCPLKMLFYIYKCSKCILRGRRTLLFIPIPLCYYWARKRNSKRYGICVIHIRVTLTHSLMLTALLWASRRAEKSTHNLKHTLTKFGAFNWQP